jgi:hypothetical protein
MLDVIAYLEPSFWEDIVGVVFCYSFSSRSDWKSFHMLDSFQLFLVSRLEGGIGESRFLTSLPIDDGEITMARLQPPIMCH